MGIPFSVWFLLEIWNFVSKHIDNIYYQFLRVPYFPNQFLIIIVLSSMLIITEFILLTFLLIGKPRNVIVVLKCNSLWKIIFIIRKNFTWALNWLFYISFSREKINGYGKRKYKGEKMNEWNNTYNFFFLGN